MNNKPDIVAVLEAYGTHVPHTVGWAAVHCPFHADRNASASVHAGYGKYNCHSCGMRGDAWDLIREHEHCTLAEAITIGKQYGGTVPATKHSVRKNSTYTPPGRRGRK